MWHKLKKSRPWLYEAMEWGGTGPVSGGVSAGSGGVFEIGGLVMCQQTTELKVRERLREWYGRGQVDSLEPVESDTFRARLTDGGLAYATVEDDGSVTNKEQEAVC